jgi:hypothetical protein
MRQLGWFIEQLDCHQLDHCINEDFAFIKILLTGGLPGACL